MTTKKFSFDLSSRELFSNEKFLINVVDALVRDVTALQSGVGGQKILSFAERVSEAQPRVVAKFKNRRNARTASAKSTPAKGHVVAKKAKP